MKIADLNITQDFSTAFEILEQSHDNVFITGKAGTGKSTFLEYFRKKTKKKVVVVAPTGVAALNVRGQTIHSFFKFKPRFVDVNRVTKLRTAKKVYKKMDVLIIDEISMVRADIFDAIERFLRYNGPKVGEPFGGVQVCVIGDMFQLPPIVSRDEADVFSRVYETPFFFSAGCFADIKMRFIEMQNIFRQTELDFINMLNRVRNGDSNREVLDFFNTRWNQDVDASHIVLTTTNKVADDINVKRLAELPSAAHMYNGKVAGDFETSKSRLPVPEALMLKEGAQVMFVRNDSNKRWVNGTIGTVVSLSARSIDVEIIKGGRARIYNIEKELWENITYNYEEESDSILENVVGTYTQYPLILAWAITIHKSQGKTLNNVVIDLGYGAFASGQLYVALSRCPIFKNISLKNKITWKDIKSDARVIDFVEQYG